MKKILIAGGVVVLLVGAVMCGVMRFPATERRTEMVMGTLCEITIVEKDQEKCEAAFATAFRMMKKIEQTMSVFDETSELSRINARAAQAIQPLSADIGFVITQSIALSRITEGAFDITTLPLSNVWRTIYGEGTDVPAAEDIERAREAVGYEYLTLSQDAEGPLRIAFENDDVAIDLGGVAKGYACDLAVQALREAGIERAMVNVGGNIYAYGKSPRNRSWMIGVKHPREKEKVTSMVPLIDSAIATSGDYEQYFMSGGKRYGHILDPRTGYPSEASISVSVIASSAMVADALSTAFFVLGPEKGLLLAEKMNGVEALFIFQSKDSLEKCQTSGFSPIH